MGIDLITLYSGNTSPRSNSADFSLEIVPLIREVLLALGELFVGGKRLTSDYRGRPSGWGRRRAY